MPATLRLAPDLVEELRLRSWARENYVPAAFRDGEWHPLILQEMALKDVELSESASEPPTGQRIVPLAPDAGWVLEGPHHESPRPALLLRVPQLAAE